MLFTSISFLYYFLPALIIIYFITPKKYKNIILLIASLIFYFYGEPKYVFLMILEIIIAYIGAILIDKYKNQSKNILITTIFIHVFLLIIFKYTDFIIQTINDISNANPNEMKLFVNTFTKALLSGNNLPVVEYTDAVLDDSVATYKSYVKFNYDKFANHKLSFSFRILDADLISNEDYIKDAVMYIYTDPDGSRTDGDYDPNRDIMLGHIHSSGTNGISLGDSGTSVIVGKEYIVDDLFDLIKKLKEC